MSRENKNINPGGVNGSGNDMVITNDKAFKALRSAIIEHAESQTQAERMKIEMFSLELQMGEEK